MTTSVDPSRTKIEGVPSSDADLHTDENMLDSREVPAQLRETGPVAWPEKYGVYALPRASEVSQARQPDDALGTGRGWLHGERFAMHRHTQGQLVYPASGLLAVTTQRGTWVAPPNRVTWTPAGFDHHHRACGSTDVRALLVPGSLCVLLPTRPTVFAVSALLREALMTLTGDRQLRPEARDRLREVVVDELTDAPEQSLPLPEPRDDRLRALADRLHANPADTSTLTALGRCVGASERTLSRLFHAELGMSFHQWRTQLRVQHALVYLWNGHTVTQTAALCGWSNTTSFIDAFSTILGQTPGRYQTTLQKTEQQYSSDIQDMIRPV